MPLEILQKGNHKILIMDYFKNFVTVYIMQQLQSYKVTQFTNLISYEVKLQS